VSFEDPDDTTEAHERRIVRCRSCNAMIIWFKTARGKNMPVDADTVKPEDEEFDPPRHVVHWSTCKNPSPFRKPTRGAAP
jgi:hypothetical protein